MIPNLLNKIKVTLGVGASPQEPKDKEKKQKKQEPKQQKKQDQSPPSPTFKKLQQQMQKLTIKTEQEKPSIHTVGKHGQSQHQFIKEAQNKKAPSQTRAISIKQLAEHKSKQSAWLSLDGIVYDVTVYLKHHPGGIILLQGCGRECRQLFDEYHSWVNGKNLLAKYKIGWLNQ